MQCDETERLCGFDLTTATIDDRKMLDPLTCWMHDGIVVGDRGYLSPAKATELAQRGVYLLTTTRKNMHHVASQFQLAYPQLRHRVEEIVAFMKEASAPCVLLIAQPTLCPFTCRAVYWPIRSISP